MRNLVVNTPGNVRIEYALASIKQRITAFVLDVLFLVSFLVLVLVLLQVSSLCSEDINNAILLGIFLSYTLICEWLMFGYTPGKLVLGIRVMRLDGRPMEFADYLLRWLFRSVDIYSSAGTIGLAMVGSTPYRQRLGDVLAGSVVVHGGYGQSPKLNELLKMPVKSDAEVQFPKVRLLSEEDVLFLRNVLIRVQRHPNKAHKEALETLAAAMEIRLDIRTGGMEPRLFIQLLVEDYVALTR